MLSIHDVSIRKLKIFMTVVDSGGFSAAQTLLGTSSATISIQMKELEEQLGLTLCQRGRSGFRLTDQGRSVYGAAQRIFDEFRNFNLAVAEIRDTLVGEVKIGLQPNTSTNAEFPFDAAIRTFHARSNSVRFVIEEAGSSDLEANTLDGGYDLAIGIFPNRTPGLDYTRLFTERVELYCSADHPLAGISNAKSQYSAIGRYPVLTTGNTEALLIKQPGHLSPATAVSESMDAAVLLVLSGQYIGYLPVHFAKMWGSRLVSVLPQRLGNDIDFHLITQRGGRGNHIVDVLVNDIVKAHEKAAR